MFQSLEEKFQIIEEFVVLKNMGLIIYLSIIGEFISEKGAVNVFSVEKVLFMCVILLFSIKGGN